MTDFTIGPFRFAADPPGCVDVFVGSKNVASIWAGKRRVLRFLSEKGLSPSSSEASEAEKADWGHAMWTEDAPKFMARMIR